MTNEKARSMAEIEAAKTSSSQVRLLVPYRFVGVGEPHSCARRYQQDTL
jgi:hypothetical protein